MAGDPGHKWGKIRSLPWPVCTRCGLVKLRNPLTDWCVRHGCDHADRPDYRDTVRRLTMRDDPGAGAPGGAACPRRQEEQT